MHSTHDEPDIHASIHPGGEPVSASSRQVQREIHAGKRYWFELYRSREQTFRARQDAAHDSKVLLRRLTGKDEAPEVSESLRELLTDYCMDVTLNIRWYERARRRALWSWRLSMGLVLSFAAAAFAVAYLLTTPGSASPGWWVLMVGLVPVLQATGAAIDHRTRMGAFWRASAELKESLFALEAAWTGKALDGTFQEAVQQARRVAHQIGHDERATFYSTYRSPGEVLSALSPSLRATRAPPGP
jgi:hypothetical protein